MRENTQASEKAEASEATLRLRDWLVEAGLSRYFERFLAERVDYELLESLNTRDLVELGLNVGDRKRFERARDRTLTGEPDVSPTREKPAVVDRRQVSVLFCDLVESTQLAMSLDQEDWRALLQAYQQTVAAIVELHGGVVTRYVGDAALCCFGVPRARERDAVSAVHTALELQTEIARLGDEFRNVAGRRIQARVAVATGSVVAGDEAMEYGASQPLLVGPVPYLAQRAHTVAEPGQVVLDETTWSIVHRDFDLEALEPVALKGIAAPTALWRAVGPRAAARAGPDAAPGVATDSGFVGRMREFAVLRDAFAQARDGTSQMISVVGEAGIGKTRLLEEFEREVRGGQGASLWLQCAPESAGIALAPLLAHLARGADRSAGTDILASAVLARRDLEEAIANLHAERTGRVLASTSTVDWITAELVDELAARACIQPLLVTVDDVHHCDPSTRAFLVALAAGCTRGLMLLASSRSQEPAAPVATQVLRLGPLSDDEAARLASSALAATPGGGNVVAAIVDRCDNVPLYIEELARATVEGLYGPPGNSTVPVDSGGFVPGAVRALLASRLDHSAADKQMAQAAAVLGRSSNAPLIAALLGAPLAVVEERLGRLATRGIFVRDEETPGGGVTFRHALIRDVAYESLLRTQRAELHRRAAIELAARRERGQSVYLEEIADHFLAAGDGEGAVTYSLRAINGSLHRSAPEETRLNAERALRAAALIEAPERRGSLELEARISLALALSLTDGFGAATVQEALSAAEVVTREVGTPRQRLRVLHGLSFNCFVRAEIDKAHRLAGEMLALARSIGDPALMFEPQVVLGMIQLHQSRFAAAHETLESAMALSESVRLATDWPVYLLGAHPVSFALAYDAWALAVLGRLDDAVARIGRSVAQARDARHHQSLLMALNLACRVHGLMENTGAVSDAAREMLETAQRYGFRYYVAQARVWLGWSGALGGPDSGAALASLEAGIVQLREGGSSLSLPFALARWCEACLAVGRHGEARQHIDEALELLARREGSIWQAYVMILDARVNLEAGDLPRARTLAAQAVEYASATGAKGFESRAVRLLAQVQSDSYTRWS